jgi:hypothetical protein
MFGLNALLDLELQCAVKKRPNLTRPDPNTVKATALDQMPSATSTCGWPEYRPSPHSPKCIKSTYSCTLDAVCDLEPQSAVKKRKRPKINRSNLMNIEDVGFPCFVVKLFLLFPQKILVFWPERVAKCLQKHPNHIRAASTASRTVHLFFRTGCRPHLGVAECL